MIVGYGTYADVRELVRLARRLAVFAEQRRASLKPIEAALEPTLQEANDRAIELFYLLADALDDLEEEDI